MFVLYCDVCSDSWCISYNKLLFKSFFEGDWEVTCIEQFEKLGLGKGNEEQS